MTSVQVRLCIYEDGHEGPCVGLDGTWWDEVPVPADVDGVTIAHVG